MCTVRVNGRVAIQDNGDIIDHMATLEWFAAPPAAPAPAAKDAEIAGLREDAERLEFIQNEYLHIIPFAMPTGADDSEVGWQVHIEAMNPADGFRHTEYRDNLRAAIDAARKGEA